MLSNGQDYEPVATSDCKFDFIAQETYDEGQRFALYVRHPT
jgi:hypothetical protein